MKKFIYIAILALATAFTVQAQGVYRLANGDEATNVIAVAKESTTISLVNVNASDEYELLLWDGYDYSNEGVISKLPKHKQIGSGDFTVKHAIWFEGKLYVAGQYAETDKVTSPIEVFSYDGAAWSDVNVTSFISGDIVNKFLIHKGSLFLAGMFQSTSLYKLESGSWTAVGSVIASNPADYLLDIVSHHDKLYATGEFTNNNNGLRFNVAEFFQGSWGAVAQPPFVQKSKVLTTYNNQLLITGDANVNFDYVKEFKNGGWDDISNGLENLEVYDFWDIEMNDEIICATGVFEDRSSGIQFNFILRDKLGWHFGDQPFTGDRINLGKIEDKIVVFGAFDFYGTKGIGIIQGNHANLTGQLFLDGNNNCVFDSEDEGIGFAKLILTPGNHIFFTDKDGRYNIPVAAGKYDLTYETLPKHEYGCGRAISVTVQNHTNYTLPDLTAVEKPNVVDLELATYAKNGFTLLRGQRNSIQLFALNNGTATIDKATLKLQMGDWWDQVTISPAPTTFDNGEYTWDVNSLERDQTFVIEITGDVKSELGDANEFCFTGEIESPQTDAETSSNRDAGFFTSADEIDPIYKQVSCGKWYSSADESITYTIRFENESSKEVNDVVVVDTFDKDLIFLRAQSYYPLAFNKTVTHVKVPGEDAWRYIYTWSSNKANLKPAGSPDGGAVGSVALKVYLHELSFKKGTQLCNTARVHLDNGEPLRTNTVCSQSTNLSNRGPKFINYLSVFPNPAYGSTEIYNYGLSDHTIRVLDQTGKLISEFALQAQNQTTINTTQWSQGVYLITADGITVDRLVVINR